MEHGSERPEPEQVGGSIWWHSQTRYLFCRQFAERKRVLDIACANGYGTVALAEVAESVVGIDISQEALGRAKALNGHAKVRYVHAEPPPLPLPDASIDLVVCLETLEHLAARDQQAFVAELSRVLAPDGVLILSTPALGAERAHAQVTGESNPYHLHTPGAEELDALLAGFPFMLEFVQLDAITSLVVPADPTLREPALQSPMARWAMRRGPEHPVSTLRVCSRREAGLDFARASRPAVVHQEDHQRLQLLWQGLELNEFPDVRGLEPEDQLELLTGRLRRLQRMFGDVNRLLEIIHGEQKEMRQRVEAIDTGIVVHRVVNLVRARLIRLFESVASRS